MCILFCTESVSYTHLDVYKRQVLDWTAVTHMQERSYHPITIQCWLSVHAQVPPTKLFVEK